MPTVDAKGKEISLSEGDVVIIEAFVLHAKHDDVPLLNPKYHGESVNCRKEDVEHNDIHIALGPTASSVECSSITAEIIPHFRPNSWDRFDNDSKTAPAVNGITDVKGLQVRITGQLFFDGSHEPKDCARVRAEAILKKQGKKVPVGDPVRRSVWEVHPVYKIEVKDGNKWTSFDDWAKKQH